MMEHMHTLLKRQLKSHFGGSFSIPQEWQKFFEAVNKAYQQFDTDREMLERSLDLSSQELLQKNSEIRAIIQAFPDLLFRINYSGEILEYKFSDQADLLSPHENLIGRNIQSIPLRDVSIKLEESINKVRDTKHIVSMEYSLKTGGHPNFYEARMIPLLENQIMVIIRNITDRKSAEEALIEGKEKFRAITNTAADAIILMNDLGNISYWNPAAERIFGYSSDEALGKDLHLFLAPKEYQDPFKEGFKSFKETGKGIAVGKIIEFEAVRKDGTRFPIEVSTSALKIRGKWHAVGIIRDITRRRRAENALKESEEKYRTLVNNISIGVYRSTGYPEGRFIQANPAIARMFGYDSLEDFMKISVNDFYQDPEDRRYFIEEAGQKGFVKDREIRLKKRDGTLITALCSATVQYDDNGALQWMDGVIEDITERKEFEEQLRQMQKMDAIGTLAGGIAHDFNNILTAVIGYGNLLKEAVQGNNQLTGYIDQVLISSERAAALTQNLLAFSRRQIINPSPVNMNEIIRKLGTLLLRVIGEDIELKIALSSEDLLVMADAMQMEQILLNLAANARDAMPNGGTLTIKTARVELDDEFPRAHGYGMPGLYACILVEDTGQGMDEQTRERIFEPFFTTKKVGKGTGLGLSMVYGIVKQHEGYVDTYSELGKRSVFKIYLPLINPKGERTDLPPHSKPHLLR
jgi:two-component system, cell cycle sensor histidine kinase and response regulator CckA